MQYSSREVYEHISKTTNDPIIEWKICAVSGVESPIYQSDLNFYDKISPSFAGQKFQIPTPTLCPEERQRRRLSFRNERKLYKRTCDATGKNIISIYSPDKDFTVYDQSYRWSDHRDPMDYGFEFDFSKTFKENFSILQKTVPLVNNYIKNSENSEYNSSVVDSKNCYLCSSTGFVDNVMYSTLTGWLTNCIDSHRLLYSEDCYHCIDSDHCYNCSYCINCEQCSDCLYCFGLINKKFCIFNEQKSEEEFKLLKDTIINNASFTKRTNLFNEKIKSNNNINSDGCVGSMIRKSTNSQLVFDVVDLNSCKYMLIAGLELKDSYDCSGGDIFQCQRCYEGGMIVMSHGLFSCYSVRESSNLSYCFNCYSCNHCFGCIGLRNKQYCIFNRQYTKEEYEIQVAKIITHMQSTGERGEFFHPSLSPFGYNETVAQEYYPLSNNHRDVSHTSSKLPIITNQEDAKYCVPTTINFADYGYTRSTYSSDPVIPAGAQTIEKKNYDDQQWLLLRDEPDITSKIIICKVSGRPFKLQKAEIEFYQKHNLPIPSKHPDIRHEERMKLRPGRTLYLRTCDCCGEEVLSVYPQDHEGKVFCEECYQKEIFA